MNTYSLVNDVQSLTQIPLNTLNKLVDVSSKDIAQIIHNSVNNTEEIFTIDIGFGNLSYQFVDDDIVFSFTPSDYLVELIMLNKNVVEDSISERLKNKILSTYKELM